jgi:hypothetical protein
MDYTFILKLAYPAVFLTEINQLYLSLQYSLSTRQVSSVSSSFKNVGLKLVMYSHSYKWQLCLKQPNRYVHLLMISQDIYCQ